MTNRIHVVVFAAVICLFAAAMASAEVVESADETALAEQPQPEAAPSEEEQEKESLEVVVDGTPPMTPATDQTFCHCFCRCGNQRVPACIPAGTASSCSQFNGQDCSNLLPTCSFPPTLSSCVPPQLSTFACP